MSDNKIKYESKGIKKEDLFFYFEMLKKIKISDQDFYKSDIYKIIEKSINEDFIFLSKVGFLNYKRINDCEVNFNERINIIIGENGVGKTSVLNGVVKNLSWMLNNILKDNNNGIHLMDDEISNVIIDEKNQTSIVTCSFQYGSHTKIEGELVKHKVGFSSKRQSKVSEYKNIGEIWREFHNFSNINLPIFSFYSVKRFNDKVSSKLEVKAEANKLDAYKGALDGNVKFESFAKWLLQCLKIISNDGVDQGYKERLEQLVIAKQSLVPETEVYKLLEEEEKRLRFFIENQNNNIYIYKQLELINGLVKKIFTDFKGFKLIQTSGIDEILLTYHNDNPINLEQLSDGERVFLGVVMDIAYRLISLNPNRENPFEGFGIIVIDEIELHLHPRWQQNSVLILGESFPNIQFIITTHSPQVLSTVDKKSIIYLKKDGVSEVSYQSKGLMSSDVLELIMNTRSIPDVKEAQDLKRLNLLLENEKYESTEFNELLRESTTHFGENHPEIVSINSRISFIKLRNTLKNKIRISKE
ncbi:AAA family ATPase [Acinetobacter guillouiae]|uniref:AAA family ATPase n=1 Tax=Acinetobacter guillouiae TaxID=106649 RepID=UPI0021D29027|nr:AAA family ATPase [Acinetobacter guillouiae]MCU4491816.1 AAA family ATPase [Acinetobacter guillouiae]